jgi:hypothetical protein
VAVEQVVKNGGKQVRESIVFVRLKFKQLTNSKELHAVMKADGHSHDQEIIRLSRTKMFIAVYTKARHLNLL